MTVPDSTDAHHLPFFVYGTLLPGQPNAALWAGLVSRHEAASFGPARLYDLGAFPLLAETRTGRVSGCLLWIEPAVYGEARRRFDELEQYDPAQPEAGPYRRRRRLIRPVNGPATAAWLYVGDRRFAAGCQVVPGGDWAAYTAARGQELARWWARFRPVFMSDSGRIEREDRDPSPDRKE